MLAGEIELQQLRASVWTAHTLDEQVPLLAQAVKANAVDIVKELYQRGCILDAMNATERMCALHWAAAGGHVDVTRFLLEKGCSLQVRDRTGATPLHWAASRGHVQVAQLLLARGQQEEDWRGRASTQSPSATPQSERPGMVTPSKLCPVDVRDHNGATSLHMAASKGHVEMARILLDQGCPVDGQDKNGRTALHDAAQNGHIDVAQLLLDRGCPAAARDKTGSTPFHSAVASGEVEAAQLLVNHGFAIQAKDGTPQTTAAVQELVRTLDAKDRKRSDTNLRRSRERIVATLHLLTSNGCSCELIRLAIRRVEPPDMALFLAAIDGWEGQHTNGDQVSSIPVEVLGGTVQDLEFFFKSLKLAGSGYRKKLCVVGPSSWGKTSFIKSLTSNQPNLESADTRTIGIDLFSWSFDMPGRDNGGHCDVSVWDFAGQDEYESVHAMFFSKRTLYVVCVNMAAYVDMLQSHNIEASGESHAAVDAFFDATIYSRIQAICAHEPASEFVFVGTKIDLVREDTAGWRQRVGDDLLERVAQREADEIFELDRALEKMESGRHGQLSSSEGAPVAVETDSKYQHLMQLRRERPKFLSDKLLAMSSADLSGLAEVRAELQRCIESSDSSFLMPWNFALVGRYLRDVVQQVKASGAMSTQLAKVFVSKDKLCQRIQNECAQAEITLDDIESILRILHALGDILWFEKADSRLSSMVFLSPGLVIDFIRKVISHELGDQASSPRKLTESEAAVRNEGRVAHTLLAKLDSWRDVKDKTVMLQLKRLLFNFDLAYPEGSDMMCWDSDLIVPTYWKKTSVHGFDDGAREIPAALSSAVSWEYEFRTTLPGSFFEKFGVRSYSASHSCQRLVTRTSFATSRASEYIAEISKHPGGGREERAYPFVRIRVCAATAGVAWKQLLWYIICLERLLEEYPGLVVERYTVLADGARGDVDRLLRMRQERLLMRGITGSELDPSSASDALPPVMNWFVNKEWNAVQSRTDRPRVAVDSVDAIEEPLRNPQEAQFAIIVAQLKQVISELKAARAEVAATHQTVVESSGEHSDYPGLWMMTHRANANAITSEYELALLSELSYKCYHEPIVVKVANPNIFGKHGDKIKNGLTLVCVCVPDMFGKGLIEFAASAAKQQLDRAKKVHTLVGQHGIVDNEKTVAMHENVELSPDENVWILRELLKLAVDAFDPLMMSKISSLVCGYWKDTGKLIWAHKDEIAMRKGEIILRNAGAVGPSQIQLRDADTTETVAPLDGPAVPAVMPPRASLDVTLEILNAQDLPNVRKVGVQSPYCKWKLLDAAHKPLADGKTAKHVRGGRSAEWDYAKVLSAVTTLAGCSLVVVVKTEMMVSTMSEVIGEGSHPFSEQDIALPTAGERCEFEVRLSSRGEFAGLLKIRLRF